MLGLADEFRAQDEAVGEEYRFDSIFYTSMGEGGRKLAAWELPSVREGREKIRRINDGSLEAEPGQRCSQIVFERWMKEKCLMEPFVDGRFGVKFLEFQEDENGVTAVVEDQEGKRQTIRSRYLVGCDGGGGTVRKCAEIRMTGGPL